MTEDERVALAWVERRLRTWICDRCGRVWLTGKSTVALFHQCNPPRYRRRRVTLEDIYDDATLEERRLALWAGFGEQP